MIHMIGGAVNGQIIMWDMTTILKNLLIDKRSSKSKQDRCKHNITYNLHKYNTLI